MRGLVSMLAAGVLAAGAVLTGGIASAGATAIHHTSCAPFGNDYFSSSSHRVNYYLGTPVNAFSGAPAFLKPKQNSTTLWNLSSCTGGYFLVSNRGLALTSRSSSPGGNVTVETAGNGGNGFASQQWRILCTTGTCSQYMFSNQKTGLWLRIRNSGAIMGQTVTTGLSATNWTRS